MDIGKFIQLIRLHKSIWNVSDSLYSNRIKRTKDIAHIANEMNITENMVKTKWKSTSDYYKKLKIKYNKEKYNQEKSGNGVEDSVEYPTWQYYDDMKFLNETLENRTTISSDIYNISEKVAEPGSPLSVARVILESESGVISETECSDIISSPVDSDPQILSCVTPDSIQSTPSTSQLALSKPHLSQRFSDKFRKLGKRKKNINLDEEILNKLESLENKDQSATEDFCASLGQLIDKYAVESKDTSDILKILSEKTFDFIQEMNIKKKSM